MKLKGKSAIITGGSLGIGQVTALLFANEGADVLITGRTETTLVEAVELAKDAPGRIEYLVSDVSKEEDCKAAVDRAVELFGKIDILFNNAGILPLGVTHETSVETWEQVFNINVKGTFMMSKFTIPHMIENGGGSIINNSSILGIKAITGTAAYNSTKGAVSQLTRSMALEYGANGIRVNAICPGTTATPMVAAFIESSPPELEEFLKGVQPITGHLGRFATPEEIAHAVLFLCDSENVAYMTGAELSVDGGWIAN
ncbi:MAG: SDR family NAD(P)-dependent oxidoreductase [Candidatus Dadabacteria bacterium]|nr:SDR family NAD(P)-dependent oxidoreductase [Candidatus Dadabacteria bacterium]